MKTQVDSEMYSSLSDLHESRGVRLSRERLTSFEDIIGKQRNAKADSCIVRTKPTVHSFISSVAVVLFFIAQVISNCCQSFFSRSFVVPLCVTFLVCASTSIFNFTNLSSVCVFLFFLVVVSACYERSCQRKLR